MEVGEATIIGLDAPEAALRMKFANSSLHRRSVKFHVQSPSPLVVFELAAGRAEGIAQSDIWVLVRMVYGVRSSDGNLVIGNGNVESNVE